MEAAGLSSRAQETRVRLFDRCACLVSPTRSSAAMKTAVVILHAIYVGGLFALDTDLMWKMIKQPWISVFYVVILLASLFQYFYTSGSSPGYVIDALSAGGERHATFVREPMYGDQRQSASRNGSFISSKDASLLEKGTSRINTSSWLKLVMELYPPGYSRRNWTCSYCNVIQPPRSRHCHDCDKCVLQFDHHCVWLGTCIGLRNHCRFWWFVFEESILSVWTIVCYIDFLRSDTQKEWWQGVIAIFLLATLFFCAIFFVLLLLFHSYLVVTNQTTYELVRRRRIFYLRGISPRVHPFSKGICRNIYSFCCVPKSLDTLEAVPTIEELEAMSRPYTCKDIFSCRCC